MKKLLALFTGLFLFVTMASPVFAVEFFGEDELYLDLPMLDDVYAGGGLISIDEDIDGDLVLAGGSITINANIKGDLIVGGGNITLNGDVDDDVRAAGGSISINGNIGDDLIVSGGNINLSKDSLVGGSLIFGAGMANILGSINEDIKGGGGKLVLGGTVYRDVEVEIQDSFVMLKDAKINGNLMYSSLRQAELTDEQVAGFIEFKKTIVEEGDIGEQVETIFSRFHLIFSILKYLSLLAVALIMVLLLPKALVDTSHIAKKHPWAGMGYGLVIGVCSIAAMILLSITVIGIPIAMILLAMLCITWYVAKVYAAMFLGSLLLHPKKMTKGKLFGITALGGFIFVVIGIVPFVGWLVAFLINLIAFGSIWTYKKQLYERIGFQKF